MPSTTKLLASAALGLTLACLAPVAGYASEVVIPAAGCTQVPVAGVNTVDARSGGGFAVTGGATASLVCAVPTDDLDSSSGDDDDDDDDDSSRVTFRVSILDSDGSGPANFVNVGLFRTTLIPGTTGPVEDRAVCGGTPFVPGVQTPTQAAFSCPRLAENAFYHLKVTLTSSGTSTAAFAGVVAD